MLNVNHHRRERRLAFLVAMACVAVTVILLVRAAGESVSVLACTWERAEGASQDCDR